MADIGFSVLNDASAGSLADRIVPLWLGQCLRTLLGQLRGVEVIDQNRVLAILDQCLYRRSGVDEQQGARSDGLQHRPGKGDWADQESWAWTLPSRSRPGNVACAVPERQTASTNAAICILCAFISPSSPFFNYSRVVRVSLSHLGCRLVAVRVGEIFFR